MSVFVVKDLKHKRVMLTTKPILIEELPDGDFAEIISINLVEPNGPMGFIGWVDCTPIFVGTLVQRSGNAIVRLGEKEEGEQEQKVIFTTMDDFAGYKIEVIKLPKGTRLEIY